jgi:heme exporter protein D
VIVGVVVIALIGMIVGIVHSIKAKKAVVTQQLEADEQTLGNTYNPDEQ